MSKQATDYRLIFASFLFNVESLLIKHKIVNGSMNSHGLIKTNETQYSLNFIPLWIHQCSSSIIFKKPTSSMKIMF